ncbi:MAG: DNA cytosine methyltransferase [Aestuariivita sp.]|nr:DNA cytosine methyltransferase [Aestuariivita sp.]
MSIAYGIVDLFAGPGGLGEGFSAFRDQFGRNPFSIEVSVEKDPAAHATLKLRSFLRKFEQGWPAEYYDFLNGRQAEPDWSKLYPEQWAAAENEARCMELGAESTTKFLRSRIMNLRREYQDRTILVGGPPCQAYSLAGRSRNAGIAGYLPHKDDRNFLYQKYVEVLRELEPAAFVMENVKGMLSSSIKGSRIFHKVMADLRSATGDDSYRLLSLVTSDKKKGGTYPAPQDFIVNMEKHGIPQARHRVIIIGIRQDVFGNLGSNNWSIRLPSSDQSVTVGDIIGIMPPLRSGLSRIDGPIIWRDTVLNAIRTVSKESSRLPKQCRAAFEKILSECNASLRTGAVPERSSDVGADIPDSCPDELRDWILDPLLDRLPNHYARGHMSSDLARYLFVSAFGRATGRSPKAADFPSSLVPNHKNWDSGKFSDRFRVQIANAPASTVTSHISKDGHYFIHPDPSQCRSLTVREAARLQTFPDNYLFKGNRTQQYVQVGNAVPPFLALQIAECLWESIAADTRCSRAGVENGSILQEADY